MKTIVFLLSAFLLFSCSKPVKQEINLIPQPVNMEILSGGYQLSEKSTINYAIPELESTAKYLQHELSGSLGTTLNIVSAGTGKGINLMLDNKQEKKDAYKLKVSKDGIDITGSSIRGLLLGIQTLKQLMPVEISGGSVMIPGLNIDDYPEWGWRGLHMDVSRHFFTKEEVKKFLDMMAMYKFNKFHWHLTDDQGWRIEIKKYPLLTQEGAWRTYNNHDRSVMKRATRESNPDYNLPEDRLRTANDTVEYGGFYTQDDIREIVAYAMERGIDVIPEIDMPGHFSAAIKAYPYLSCFGKAGWGSQFSAPICPGKDRTLEFCKDVYREVFELFPCEYIHMGADEVEKTNWIKCPDCQTRIRKNKLKDEKGLQSWFVHQMEDFFNENGKKLIGWDEILEGGLSKNSTVMWWRSWMKNAVNESTAQGNEVILTPNNHYYFDYQQDYSTLKNLYQFNPVPQGLSPEQEKLILGVQANTWAEYIPSIERFEYMVFPRVLAISETAWCKDSVKNWDDFQKRLIAHFERLDALDINYRPLDLVDLYNTHAFVGETMVTWNNPLTDVEIRYTTDGSVPDKNSTLYSGPFKLSETTDFNIRYFRPNGTAGEIAKTSYRKEEYRTGVQTGEVKPGLNLKWHEAVVKHTSEIDNLPVKNEYIVEGITVPAGINNKRALTYSGFLNIEKEGIYTFTLGSDDGSKLYIHDETVVDNDGPHGPVTLVGQMALRKGAHPFRLYYFDMNNGGFISLRITDPEGKELTGQVFSY